MSVTVTIPTLLRNLTANADKVNVEAGGQTVAQILDQLNERYGGFRERIFEDQEKVRRFINIYVNQEDIRFLKGLSTPVSDGAEVSIVLAVAGG